jgi:hypothetical protein
MSTFTTIAIHEHFIHGTFITSVFGIPTVNDVRRDSRPGKPLIVDIKQAVFKIGRIPGL